MTTTSEKERRVLELKLLDVLDYHKSHNSTSLKTTTAASQFVAELMEAVRREIQRSQVKRSGGDSPAVKQEESTTTPTQVTAFMDTFSLQLELGEALGELEHLRTSLTKISDRLHEHYRLALGGHLGPPVQENWAFSANPYREAINKALDELGQPHSDTPAPVANAVMLLRDALIRNN